MERLGKRILLIAMGVLVGISAVQAAPNKLTMVDHHLNTNPASLDLELGTLVFYFDRKPTIQDLSDISQNKFVFLFTGVELAGVDVAAMINKMNASKPRNYTVKIEKTKSPVAGLKLTITCKPEQVGVSYDHFPSIKMQSGVIFHMHNKELLSKINASSQKEVLAVAKLHSPRVVIDCGHGGSDTGAIGCAHIQEKEVLLPIGLEVARLLKSQGVEAVLTRNHDCTMSLGQRTSLANNRGADAFVSIHANSAPSKGAKGIETFCVNPQDLHTKFVSLDAREKKLSDSFFLKRCSQAQLLADTVHENLLATMSKNNYLCVDRKVKHAASQILLGAHMPAVLIEVGFVTNESEARLLAQLGYQQTLAQGICAGIIAFLHAQQL